jgi:hypothetical protein
MSDGGLRKLFTAHFNEAHFVPVESWSTGKGVPDVNYCFPGGHEGWIENKATTTLRLNISPEQVAWAERRLRCGGRIFLAARRQTTAGPRKGPSVDELWLFPGIAIRWLISQAMDQAPGLILKSTGGPRNWDWAGIKEVLVKVG